jgi:hypothetical protein
LLRAAVLERRNRVIEEAGGEERSRRLDVAPQGREDPLAVGRRLVRVITENIVTS